MLAFLRIAFNVIVGEEPLLLRLIVTPSQADDDAMNMRLAPGVAHPCESAVREGDFQRVTLKKPRPELRHLFALRDRIGRDKTDAGLALP
jgi:hypothetical protein